MALAPIARMALNQIQRHQRADMNLLFPIHPVMENNTIVHLESLTIRPDANPPEDGQFESEERDDNASLPCDRQSFPPALTSGVVFRGVHRQDFQRQKPRERQSTPGSAWEEDSIPQGQGYEASGIMPVELGRRSHRQLYDAQKAAKDSGHYDDTRAKAQERSSETVDMIAGIEQLLQI